MSTHEVANGQTWRAAYDVFAGDFGLPADGIGLYAIHLRFGLDDPRLAAADSITGGSDDKKCDVVYLDRDRGVAVIAQCYMAISSRPCAPANKASDLNTAVTWMLSADLGEIPDVLRPRAEELREAIREGEIKELHVWYVHNLPESQNVASEMVTVEQGARAHLGSIPAISVFAREIGSKALSELYSTSERVVAVSAEFSIDVPDAIEVETGKWSSLLTVVPGSWLYELFEQHREDLFSANVRDYLGSRASDGNINNGIKSTASSAPEDFFVYNNGVTALVMDYDLGPRRKRGRSLKITGISIVNGAQTTGSLGNLAAKPSDELKVAVRFVKCSEVAVVENLVRYNNSQNSIQAADFRSSDVNQVRLRKEFAEIEGANYEGGRRGGASDAMKRTRATLPSYTVGQVLTAFHGEPLTAYDKKSDIWVRDDLYSRVFNERTTAEHIIFCYSLLEAITARHLELAGKVKANEDMMEAERMQYEFLRQKGANYLLVYSVASVLETILGKPVANRFDLKFSKPLSVSDASAAWSRVLHALLPLVTHLSDAFARGRLAREDLQSAVDRFVSLVGVIGATPPPEFAGFAEAVSGVGGK